MRSGASAACGLRPTTRSARTSATSSRRSGPTGSTPSGSTSPAVCSRAGSPPRSVTRRTRRSNLRVSSASRRAGPAAGAEIVEGQRVTELSQLDAETVVVATDGYPSGLLGQLEGLIVPTRGQVIATEPLAERLFDVPHYGRHGFDYWHQAEDGRLVAGGFRDVSLDREFTDEEAVTDDVQRALSTFVDELVGRELRVDYRWAGIFGLVLDFLPVVGPVPGLRGVWVAGGYSGHGNVLGFACGRLVARALLGDRDPLLDLFEPARLLDRTTLSSRQTTLVVPDTALSAPRASARPRAAPPLSSESDAGRSSSTDRRNARRAIARSWIARPVESKSVVSASSRRPSASPASTRPQRRHVARGRPRRRDRAGQLAAVARLLPVVAEERPRASSSTATSALPGPSAPISDTCWPGRSDPGP